MASSPLWCPTVRHFTSTQPCSLIIKLSLLQICLCSCIYLKIKQNKTKLNFYVSRWLFWVWATSVRTTWWTYLWLICYRIGRASPGKAMTGWSHALNPPPFLRAFSHWCWCSACLRPRLQRWRCTLSGTWSPSGQVMDLACLTTIDEMLCWPGCYLKILVFTSQSKLKWNI